MADDREMILSRVRAALAPLRERARMPEYDGGLVLARSRRESGDPMAEFASRMRAVNGEVVSSPQALAAALRERKWMRGYCDPALWPGWRALWCAGKTACALSLPWISSGKAWLLKWTNRNWRPWTRRSPAPDFKRT